MLLSADIEIELIKIAENYPLYSKKYNCIKIPIREEQFDSSKTLLLREDF